MATSKCVVINGISFHLDSDDVCISSQDGEMTLNGNNIDIKLKPDQKSIDIRVVEGCLVSLTTDGNVIAAGIKGNVNAKGNVKCDCVGGSVTAGANVNCGRVGGSISATGSVRHA